MPRFVWLATKVESLKVGEDSKNQYAFWGTYVSLQHSLFSQTYEFPLSAFTNGGRIFQRDVRRQFIEWRCRFAFHDALGCIYAVDIGKKGWGLSVLTLSAAFTGWRYIVRSAQASCQGFQALSHASLAFHRVQSCVRYVSSLHWWLALPCKSKTTGKAGWNASQSQ